MLFHVISIDTVSICWMVSNLIEGWKELLLSLWSVWSSKTYSQCGHIETHWVLETVKIVKNTGIEIKRIQLLLLLIVIFLLLPIILRNTLKQNHKLKKG